MQGRQVVPKGIVGSLCLLLLFLLGGTAGAAAIPEDTYLVDPEQNTGFGEGISGLGDVNGDGFADFAVCAPRKKLPDGSEGEVRVYFGGPNGVGPEPTQVLRASSTVHGFGFRVVGGDLNQDGFGDAIVLGLQPQTTNESHLTLWIYWGSPSGLQSPTNAAYREPYIGGPEGFGILGVIGDVNGDGFPDVAVGLPAAHQEDGEVMVFHGNPAGQWDAPNRRIRGSQPGEYLGPFGQFRCDFNRDGYDDLLVGSTHYHRWGDHYHGRVQLFLGSKDGLQTNAAWMATFRPFRVRPHIDHEQQFFGNYIVVDDFNRDGLSDAVITAPYAGQNDRNEGFVFAYYGTRRSPGLPSSFDWTVQANRIHASLGLMAYPAGDVNGDGYPDLLVGAPNYSDVAPQEGLIAVFFGSARGFSSEPNFTARGDMTDVRLGLFGSGVGDLNGDGYDDLVVSQSGAIVSATYTTPHGVVRIIYGTANGPRGSTETRLAKPILQWIAQEWQRLSFVGKGLVGLVGFALLGLMGVTGRRIWKKRTIILVEQRERRSRTEERERLARDLHDELGSRISRLHLIAERVREDLDNPGAVRTISDVLTQEAQDLRTAIEQVASTLKPEIATPDGLVQALNQHANSFFARTPVRCFQDLPLELPPLELPKEVGAELFPCVREALANVLRHSQATEVWFKIRWEDHLIRVSVEDNGVGFLPAEVREGNGLRNFRTRLASLGGQVELQSSPGRGTYVAFEIATGPHLPSPPER